MMRTEDLILKLDGAAKLDIEIKSDWLLICFTFVNTCLQSDRVFLYFRSAYIAWFYCVVILCFLVLFKG